MLLLTVLCGLGRALTGNLTEILATLAFICCALYIWLQYQYSYWRRQRIPYIEPSLLFGNLEGIIKSEVHSSNWFKRLYYDERAKDQPAVGIYVLHKPSLLIRDPELIKAIMIKDFNYFSDRHASSDPHTDSIGSDNIFFAKNPRWKQIRVKMTPAFSSGKMKQLFPLMQEVACEYEKYLYAIEVDPKTNSKILEVREANVLYTTDVIAITAYGVQANTLNDPNSIFRKRGREIFGVTWLRSLVLKAAFFLPILVKIFRYKVFSKKASIFLRDLINHVMEERKRTGLVRNDLVDVFIKFKQEAEEERKAGKQPFILERDTLAAQAALFFVAGFEPSSSAMTNTMFEMAQNPDVQRRMREELHEAYKNNDCKITYEMVMGLKYMNNVIKEVLRCYSQLPFVERVCTPIAGEAGYSLKSFGIDFTVPRNMPIYIPISGIQMDPKNFKDPERFNPDRFLPENKHENNMNAYMPFGIGPHNCIGERFAMMQTKLGLLYFFRNHSITICDQTPTKIPFEPRSLFLKSSCDIKLKLVHDPLF